MTIGPGVLGVRGRQHHRRPPALAVADDRRLRALRVQFAHALDEAALGSADIEQRLARLRHREEDDEVDRMALAQRHADLRIVLEAADARSVTRARVDDHVRAALRVDRDAGRRHDLHQRVVDGALERAAVEHHLEVEIQHRRQPGARVFEVLVAALAHRIQEKDAALHGVDRVARPVPHDVERRGDGGNVLHVVVAHILDALVVVLHGLAYAVLIELRDLGGDVHRSGQVLAVVHRFLADSVFGVSHAMM